MKIVDHITDSPEENLALDELLLDRSEKGGLGETLRFWTSKQYFVVLGRACKLDKNCFIEACARDGVKILRRISGGGTVLQGPGCINYSVILSYGKSGIPGDISESYKTIMNHMTLALRGQGLPVEVSPLSDLSVLGKKVSGNAQKRGRQYLLHHGTFLLDFNISIISKYLKHPPKEPVYRENRSHDDFLTNLSMPFEELRGIIISCFGADGMPWRPSSEDREELQQLISKKYLSDEWNKAF